MAPAELEALLLSNPKILDAAVIGVYKDGNELPRSVTCQTGILLQHDLIVPCPIDLTVSQLLTH